MYLQILIARVCFVWFMFKRIFVFLVMETNTTKVLVKYVTILQQYLPCCNDMAV